MLTDEEFETLAVLAGQAEAPGDGRDHLCSLVAVILPFPLADVVQQDGEKQEFAFLNLVCDLGQKLLLDGIIPPPDLADLFNGKEGMHIDGVDVIGIVLHFAIDIGEFGNKVIEELQVVHLSQGLDDTGRAAQNFEKAIGHDLGTPHLVVDAM